jgi:hypothetical protein
MVMKLFPGAAHCEAQRSGALQTRDPPWTPDQQCTAPLRCALHRIRGTNS